jgi:DNA-binding beta-propeller fold protein YncE
LDRQERFHITDEHTHQVSIFDLSGEFVKKWGGPGRGDGEFSGPAGIAVDADDHIYIADQHNHRIQKFTANGAFLASYGESGDGNGQFSRPSGVAVDPDGYMYISDWGNERLQVLSPDGDCVANLRGQATLSRWAEEFFAVNPDERETRAMSNLFPDLPPHLRSPHHVSSQTEAYFWGPVSVRLDHQGRLFVTEANRHRIQVYQRAK